MFERVLFIESRLGVFLVFFLIVFQVGHTQQEVRSFIFGNSLVNHISPITSGDLTTVPYWLHFIAEEAGNSYAVSGQWGFLPQHTDLPPDSQWGFDSVAGAWDADFETFAQANFDNIVVTPANFSQWQGPAEDYFDQDFSPIEAADSIFQWCIAQEDSLVLYIYEGWPDMAPYLNSGFPPDSSEWDAYNDYIPLAYHDWFLEMQDSLIGLLSANCVSILPVGPVIEVVLTTSPFDQMALTDLYEDDAPHGTPTIYFLAALVTYMAMYEEKAPSSFQVPNSIDSVLVANYQTAVDLIWSELLTFYDSLGQSRVFCPDPNLTTSIGLTVDGGSITMCPNPNGGFLHVDGSLSSYDIQVLDINGQVQATFMEVGSQMQLDLSSLPSGIYFVRVENQSNGLVSIELLVRD